MSDITSKDNLFKVGKVMRNMNEKRGFYDSKKAQGLSTNAIILIILGVIILVVLVAGFALGWNTIFPFLKQNNVDSVKNACISACSTEGAYDYCYYKRDLKADDASIEDATCFFLASKMTKYGVAPCSSISCENVVFDAAECAEGKDLQKLEGKKVVHSSCSELTTE